MILSYLKRFLPSVILGNLCAVILALVAVLLGTIVGPCIQVLSSPDSSALIDVSAMLGERMGWVADLVFGEEDMSRDQFLLAIPFVLVGITTVKAAVTMLQWFTWERVGEKVSRDLRGDLVSDYLKLDPETKLTDPKIDEQLSSLLSTDIRYIREYIVRFYGGLPREGVQTVLLVISLVLLSPKLFAIFALGIGPVLILVNRLGKRLKKRANRALTDFSGLTEWLQQRLLGIETIKHYGTEQLEFDAMVKLNDTMYRRFFSAAKVKAMTSPLIEMMSVIAIAVIFLVSFRMIADGGITGAVLISFFATLGLLSQSAGKLGKYFNKNREAAAAIDRVKAALSKIHAHHRPRLPFKDLKDEGDVQVKCESVSYQYPTQRGFALREFNFEFEPGRIYGLVGPSGSGKSTLFNSILGMVQPQSGEVRVRGGRIGYLPQSYALLGGTVASNIAYPNETPDENRVRQLVKQFKLQDRITDVNEAVNDGVRALSGGQIQRLHIARLAYHRYRIVLFDEGTSALDPETENEVFGYLRTVAQNGGIVVMIAHRPSAIRYADQVLAMEDGRLVEVRDSP